ncbi:MAG: hypothetical protein EBW51_09320 [Actinobacteria bacterium]|nr:hypothetical protein [Actinomycetota bacterium]
MNAVAQVIQFPASDADRLGQLAAQIADLQAQYDAIADAFRTRGQGRFEGSMFAVTVSDETLVQTFDTKAAKAKLLEVGVAQSWIDGNVKISVRKAAVKVGAR